VKCVALIGKKPHDAGKNRIRRVAVMFFTKYQGYDDKVKNDEMGETCSKHGRDKK
jgi:hypothetical protein